MAKMLTDADKEAIAKEKVNIRWVTCDGLNFKSDQVLESIKFHPSINRWLINEDLEFLSLQGAMNYVAECQTN